MPEYRRNAENPSATSSSLLHGIQTRHPDAWHRFVGLYGPLVFWWCRQSNVASGDAADVTQEVFRAVAFGVETFQRNHKGSFRSWLRTITRNQTYDFFRRHGREVPTLDNVDALDQFARSVDSASGNPADKERNLLTQRALKLVCNEFEAKTWQAFWRCTIDDADVGEVAAELAMTKGAVRQAKYRVLQRLRQELADLE